MQALWRNTGNPAAMSAQTSSQADGIGENDNRMLRRKQTHARTLFYRYKTGNGTICGRGEIGKRSGLKIRQP